MQKNKIVSLSVGYMAQINIVGFLINLMSLVSAGE